MDRLAALLVFTFCLFTFAFAQSAEPIREAWRRPLPDPQCLAIAPDGSRIAVVTWAGEVICWKGGRESWRRRLPGATAVALTSGGQAVIYSPLDALRRDLVIVGPDAESLRRTTVGSPITAVAVSPDGTRAAVGTAGRAVEIHRLNKEARQVKQGGGAKRGAGPRAAGAVVAPRRVFHPQRIALPGPVRQLVYDGRGGLLVATTGPARLVALSPEGRVLWRSPAHEGKEFQLPDSGFGPLDSELTSSTVTVQNPKSKIQNPQVMVAAIPELSEEGGGRQAAAVRTGSPNAQRLAPNALDQFDLVSFSATGKPTVRQTLSGRDPRLSVMADGGVVVAYQRADRRGVVVRYDRWLACYGPKGALRWQRGGMIYDPLLVAATPGGDAVLSLSASHRFWLLDRRGQPLWSFTSAAPVRIARASADGSAVAVATTDGHLSYLEISTGRRAAQARGQEPEEGKRKK